MNRPKLLPEEKVIILSYDRNTLLTSTMMELSNYIEYYDKDEILNENLYDILWVKDAIDHLVKNGEDISKEVLFQIDQMYKDAVSLNATYIRFVN